MLSVPLLALCLLTLWAPCRAFKAEDFKSCADSAFCGRLRGVKQPEYRVRPDSVRLADGRLTATLTNTAENKDFPLTVTAYDGVLRVHVTEPGRRRYEVQDVLVDTLEPVALERTAGSAQQTTLTLGGHEARLRHAPFQLELPGVLTLNARGLFGIEHARPKPAADAPAGEWEETFKGHADSKPRGPQALSLDITFHGFQHVYGLPEHATDLSLPPTTGGGVATSDPYRLYNLDVFEYLAHSPFGLYGSIPYLTAHRVGCTVAAFWLNAAEMYVDVQRGAGGSTETQWWAESGVVDLFLLLGPKPADVAAQYAALTGTSAMPQMFSTGYHQCRWNYKDEADVAAVSAGFDAHAMPADVVWLDIEHTDGKRYMTWDAAKFPTPRRMIEDVASVGRKMVTIVDPHVKRDDNYALHKEATQKGYYVKNKDGKVFEGWCWPGSSSYLDVTDPEIRAWWAAQFAVDAYRGSTHDLFIWNDMNEPSVFNGPEITMPKDALHAGGVEHRDVHNVYGLYYHWATAEGLRRRGPADGRPAERPFVLSRAFFAGTQRVGPVWTGDNAATWEQLKVSVPMLLSLNVAGLPNCGADVGGFFGNPEPELLARWYQAAALTPFFRGHAHLEAKRREPWLFGEPYTTHIRAALRERYALLPYIYTLFRAANAAGAPIMRPLWYEFPDQADLFAEQHAYMLGSALLVAPVLEKGAAQLRVAFPQATRWYGAADGEQLTLPASGHTTLDVTPESMPRFYRGGHIVARRERPRRSTRAQRDDPFTLVVALDDAGAASGSLYLDDSRTFAFLEGAYLEADITFSDLTLRYVPRHTGMQGPETFERVVVLGRQHVAPEATYKATWVEQGTEVEVARGDAAVGGWCHEALVLRNPQTPVAAAWTLRLRDE